MSGVVFGTWTLHHLHRTLKDPPGSLPSLDAFYKKTLVPALCVVIHVAVLLGLFGSGLLFIRSCPLRLSVSANDSTCRYSHHAVTLQPKGRLAQNQQEPCRPPGQEKNPSATALLRPTGSPEKRDRSVQIPSTELNRPPSKKFQQIPRRLVSQQIDRLAVAGLSSLSTTSPDPAAKPRICRASSRRPAGHFFLIRDAETKRKKSGLKAGRHSA